jgi:hypothetical protein
MIYLRYFIYRFLRQLIATYFWRFLQRIDQSNQGQQHREGIVVFSPFLASQEGEFDRDEKINGVANMEANRQQFHEHIHAVVIDAEIRVLIGGGEMYIPKSEQMKGIFDIEEILIAEDIHGHEHDVEVAYRLEQGDVGDEDGGVLAALLLDVVEARDQQGDYIELEVLRVDTSATTNRMMSRAPGKKSICAVRAEAKGSLITRRFCIL